MAPALAPGVPWPRGTAHRYTAMSPHPSVGPSVPPRMEDVHDMTIPFTKAEYRALLDLVYLGEWMLTAHDQESDPDKERYRVLSQKIYSHAKAMGCESLVEADREDGKHFPTRKYEDSGIRDVIDDYDNKSFWEELIHRLTDRDLALLAPHLVDQFPRSEEYWTAIGELGERYSEEFAAHGLTRVKVNGI